jgi:hypothetical protein
MSGLILLVIGIIVLLVIFVILLTLVLLKKKEKGTFEEPDYHTFFVMGISFLPMGIVFTIVINPAFISFIGVGICYIAIGLANKDKWKKRD